MVQANVLVTGASGFIGSSVVSELVRRGCRLTCLSRNRIEHPHVEWIKFDLEDAVRGKLPDRIRPELVLHLAWEGIPDLSEEMSLKNYEMGVSVLSSLIDRGTRRIVISGSCLEYGEVQGEVSENQSPNAPAPFGRIKNELFEEVRKMAGDSCQILNGRIFYAYGPGQREASLIPSLYQSLVSGKPISLRSPNAAQDFIEVTDVASGLVELMLNNSARGGVYNIGNGTLTTVSKIASTVSRLLNKNFEIQEPVEPKGFFANNLKLKELGWMPKISIEAGLKQYIVSRQKEL